MSIEEEIFKKYKVNCDKLISYGFKEIRGVYCLTKEFMDSRFRADISITKDGKVCGKVIELALNEEYYNLRIKNIRREFANKVKDEYIKILKDIADNCFFKENFIFDQTNRIAKIIQEKYDVKPEFLWDTFPNYGVFRNKRSKKWFGIIMNIDKSKIIANQSGEIEVLNVKLDAEVCKWLKVKGIYPAYHLSKKSWVSIILDDTLKDEEIVSLVEISFNMANLKGEWLVPANPKYYNVAKAFKDKDTILWKQSSNILVGDVIYIYMAAPISAILYKCEVIENDILYHYEDANLKMDKVMKIKLLQSYDNDVFSLQKLKEFGIKGIRGPRGLTDSLSKELNRKL